MAEEQIKNHFRIVSISFLCYKVEKKKKTSINDLLPRMRDFFFLKPLQKKSRITNQPNNLLSRRLSGD